MAPRLPFIALALAALALLAACSGVLDSRAEQALREALPRVVGPADAYEVTVAGSSLDASRFERVRVAGRRVARANAPVLDAVELELRGVVVDREARALRRVDAASGSVRIAAADLAEYLSRRGWNEEPQVAFLEPDRLTITGVPRVGGLAVPLRRGAEFQGRLRADGARLMLVVDRLRLGDRDAPALVRAIVERAVNPLFDASPYPLPERIDAVAVEGDAVRIAASGSRLGNGADAPAIVSPLSRADVGR